MKYDLITPVLEIPGYPSIVYVNLTSAMAHKKALADMARYFKMEFRYDSLQYDEFDADPECTGVLICERALDQVRHEVHFPNYVVGGCCFRKHDGGHFLDWVWLHPFARNRGKMKSVWPEFRDRFGRFSLSKPLSPHMQAFLTKHAPEN